MSRLTCNGVFSLPVQEQLLSGRLRRLQAAGQDGALRGGRLHHHRPPDHRHHLHRSLDRRENRRWVSWNVRLHKSGVEALDSTLTKLHETQLKGCTPQPTAGFFVQDSSGAPANSLSINKTKHLNKSIELPKVY